MKLFSVFIVFIFGMSCVPSVDLSKPNYEGAESVVVEKKTNDLKQDAWWLAVPGILLPVGVFGLYLNFKKPSLIDCSGSAGDWDFGARQAGPLKDPAAPFITDDPGVCRMNQQEKKSIVQSFIDAYQPSFDTRKVAIFTLGAPGSGKSSSLARMIQEIHYKKENFIWIDPDEARSQLGDFQKMTQIKSAACPGKKRAYVRATEACLSHGRTLRDELLNYVWENGNNFVFDTPCQHESYCQDLIKKAKSKGYQVYLLAVFTDEQKAIKRSLERAYQTGRYISPQVVKNLRNGKAFNTLKPFADEYFIFDNNRDGEQPIKVYDKNLPCDPKQPACLFYRVF